VSDLFNRNLVKWLGRKERNVVVVVGAHNSIEDANLPFLQYLSKSDILYLLEPNPIVYDWLVKGTECCERPPRCNIISLCYGIADINGQAKLYHNADNFASNAYSGLHGSVRPHNSSYHSDCYTVCEFRTFWSFCNDLDIRDIDLLIVDTEGYDYDILKQVIAMEMIPAILVYEHVHLGKKELRCEKLLDPWYTLSKLNANTICFRRGEEWIRVER
jgi:FkbM family methyltransferase